MPFSPVAMGMGKEGERRGEGRGIELRG